jgi:hypothetical protein
MTGSLGGTMLPSSGSPIGETDGFRGTPLAFAAFKKFGLLEPLGIRPLAGKRGLTSISAFD